MDIAKRRQNERKFGTWRDLPDGGRLYSYEVKGRSGWLAKYLDNTSVFALTRAFARFDVADTSLRNLVEFR